jgi:PAS domain S-box-containing protein
MQLTNGELALNEHDVHLQGTASSGTLNGQSRPTTIRQPLNRILLVEDSRTQAHKLRRMLEAEGYAVEIAPDGEKGFELCGDSAFDLVISDIVMPGLSGYELCRKIKEDPVRSNVPVILLTSLTEPMDIVRGLECGADNFITKTYHSDHLLARVRNILDQKALHTETKLKVGAEVFFLGKKLIINSNSKQILNLLISTFEDVVRTNTELRAREAELAAAKSQVDQYARELEGQVRSSEDKYRQLMEQAQDAIFLLDPFGKVLEINNRLEELLGLPAAQIIGYPCEQFMLTTELVRFREQYERLLADGTVRTDNLHFKRADGRPVFVDFSASVVEIDDKRIVQAIVHDVTERKRIEQGLVAQHATTKILAESSTLEEAAPKLLKAICEHLEWDVGELWKVDQEASVLRFLNMWHSPAIGVEAVNRQIVTTRGDGLAGRIWASGEPAYIPNGTQEGNFQSSPVTAASGLYATCGFPLRMGTEVLGTIVFFSRQIQPHDEHLLATMAAIATQIGQFIERKQAEEALSASEERFHLLVDGVKDYAILMLDPKGHIATWNVGAERIQGYRTGELIGKHFSCFYSAEDVTQGKPELELQQSIVQGRYEDEAWRVRKDGTQFRANIVITPLYNNLRQHIGFSKVTRDVTERNRLEERIRQSQKMEAFGQLAGGVAHDFNNLLTIISGYSEMTLRHLPPDEPTRDFVGEIQKAGERAASLTSQLLAFSRQQMLEPKVLDLNGVVSDTETMLRRLIGADIRLTAVLDETLRPVKADAGQIEQIIINLAVNARDAMPQGGKLTIETANVDFDENYLKIYPEVKQGRYSMVSVSDSGCGMDAATKARIFEPFYTTKEIGKGTGLGLATVYGIVQQSEGHIEVNSEPGRGTSFKVYLPSVESDTPIGKFRAGLAAMPRGTETILLVEDDDSVRKLARDALQTCGYTVLEANHGKEALRLCESYSGPIHLLVSDVVMPHMGGRHLAESLTALKLVVKVLFISGYTDDAVMRHGVLEAETAFLQKPFKPGVLAQKVRAVLDQ